MTKKVFDHEGVTKRREALRLSRHQLAEKCGMKRTATIREIELGAVPGSNTVAQLAAGLGCGIEDLYTESGGAPDAVA